jgi:hypothetical protein
VCGSEPFDVEGDMSVIEVALTVWVASILFLVWAVSRTPKVPRLPIHRVERLGESGSVKRAP